MEEGGRNEEGKNSVYKYSGLGIRQFNRSTLHFSNGILPLSPCEKNHKDNL